MIESAASAELAALRAQIDDVDGRLVDLLAERFACTAQVGRLKAQHGLAAVDPARERAQAARIDALARAAGVDQELAARLFRLILEKVVQDHRALRAELGAQ